MIDYRHTDREAINALGRQLDDLDTELNKIAALLAKIHERLEVIEKNTSYHPPQGPMIFGPGS